MTYAVGWVADGVAYLIADTLVTGGSPDGPSGSFLEPRKNDRGEHLSQSMLKIHPLGNNVAIALAGNVESGKRIIGFIRENFSMLHSLSRLFEIIKNSMGPFNDTVELIIAGYTESNEAFVLSWSTENCKLRRPRGPVQIGQASEVERIATCALIDATRKSTKDRQLFLAIVVTQMQAYCLHDKLSERGIGGAFIGLSIGGDGISWMGDVTYLLVTPSGIRGLVLVRVRDGFSVTHSTLHKDPITIVLGSGCKLPDPDKLESDWRSKARELTQDPESEFMSCLDLAKRMSVLIRRSPRGSWQGHVIFKRAGGNATIALGANVSAQFVEDVKPRNDQLIFDMFLVLAGDLTCSP